MERGTGTQMGTGTRTGNDNSAKFTGRFGCWDILKYPNGDGKRQLLDASMHHRSEVVRLERKYDEFSSKLKYNDNDGGRTNTGSLCTAMTAVAWVPGSGDYVNQNFDCTWTFSLFLRVKLEINLFFEITPKTPKTCRSFQVTWGLTA